MKGPAQDWHIVELGATDSTNTQLARLVLERYRQNEPADRIALIAERQSAGRGQHGRTWESPEGGLYLSASAENIPPTVRDRLALAAGVAVAHALEDMGVKNVGVRWPNDVMFGTRKLGGILCEAVALGNRFAAIIGIGLNVNTPLESLPPSVRATAMSLIAVDGVHRDVPTVAHALLAQLARTLDALDRHGLAPIIHELRGLDMLRGREVTVVENGIEIIGRATGVSPAGELMVRTRARLEIIGSGTVTHVENLAVRG